MMSRIALAFAAVLAWTSAGHAQAGDPFTITHVPVDASADNAADAQREALSQGQLDAAQRLIDRLTLARDREGPPPRLGFDDAGPRSIDDIIRRAEPDTLGLSDSEAAALVLDENGEVLIDPLEAWDGTGLPPLSADEAAAMIAGLEIAREQRSATRYIAELVVSFDRREVAAYFDLYDVPYVESQARPVLVVPARDGGSLWSGPWADAWIEGDFQHSLAPAIALGSVMERLEAGPIDADAQADAGGTPNGGEVWIEDGEIERVIERPLGRDALTMRQALDLDVAALRGIAEIYGVDQVMVVAAASASGGVRAQGVLVDFAGGQTRYDDLPTVAAGTYADAARLIVEAREAAWKEAAVVRDRTTKTFAVTVSFGGLREWLGLRTDIAAASLVTNARLDALSREGALMTLTHRGGVDQLASELAQRGVRLEEDETLGWTARRSR